MKYITKISLTILIFVSCSPREKNDISSNHNKYRIIAEKNGKISGFEFEDNNDTMQLRYFYPTINQNTIVIDDKTKAKIKEVFRYHLSIDNFDSHRKKRGGIGTITFELSSSEKLETSYVSNKITIKIEDIAKNSDASNEYEQLIDYLKSKYKQFEKWPN